MNQSQQPLHILATLYDNLRTDSAYAPKVGLIPTLHDNAPHDDQEIHNADECNDHEGVPEYIKNSQSLR
jgi:hypothetical protein